MSIPTGTPDILKAYFDASNAHDIDRITACFAGDARVRDEGEDITGHPAIAAWARKVRDKYNATARILSHEARDGADFVTAKVSGTFPGSPIELTYRFGVSGGKITSLAIA